MDKDLDRRHRVESGVSAVADLNQLGMDFFPRMSCQSDTTPTAVSILDMTNKVQLFSFVPQTPLRSSEKSIHRWQQKSPTPFQSAPLKISDPKKFFSQQKHTAHHLKVFFSEWNFKDIG